MKSKLPVIAVAVVMLMLFSISSSYADRTIHSPEDMINSSTTILVGEVTYRDYTEQRRRATVHVEAVYKGRDERAEITHHEEAGFSGL